MNTLFSIWQHRRFPLVVVATLGLTIFQALVGRTADTADKPAAAKDKAASADDSFIRLVRDDRGRPQALQTALVRYVNPAKPGQYVDLIGAIHVGDEAYYTELNRRFTGYDALLYELVAPPEKKVPTPGKGSNHPVGMMQQGMKEVLDLEHQLDKIDYKKDNFVHADMSPDEFSQAMADRNESLLGLMFRMMGQGMALQGAQQANGSDIRMLMAFFQRNRALALKRAMAEQFELLDDGFDALGGPDGSAIITDRNKAALKVLRQQLDAGKQKLGIFYGAGHLSDMDERLIKEFGLKRDKTEWLTAWNLADEKPAAKKADQPAPPKKGTSGKKRAK